jgi:hypothetical protein
MSKDLRIGVNWHLRFRLEIETLKNKIMLLEIDNIKLKGKLKQYENNNTGSTGNRKDNNVVKFGGRIYSKRN